MDGNDVQRPTRSLPNEVNVNRNRTRIHPSDDETNNDAQRLTQKTSGSYISEISNGSHVDMLMNVDTQRSIQNFDSQALNSQANNDVKGNTHKRVLTDINLPPTEVVKYQKMDDDDGYIVGCHYIPNNEDKLQNFKAQYWGFNPKKEFAKELVGLKLNSVYVNTKSKQTYEQPRYLVLSFENRYKEKAPHVEFALGKLDCVIKVLQDIKEFAKTNGYYKEGLVQYHAYEKKTIITQKHTKDKLPLTRDASIRF